MTHIDMTQVIPREYERVLAVVWRQLAKHERKAHAKRASQPASYRWPHTISVDEPKPEPEPDQPPMGRQLVLAHLANGRATARQVSDATGMSHNIAQRRLRQLLETGEVRKAGFIMVYHTKAFLWERVT